jgi:hypothetical protein
MGKTKIASRSGLRLNSFTLRMDWVSDYPLPWLSWLDNVSVLMYLHTILHMWLRPHP